VPLSLTIGKSTNHATSDYHSSILSHTAAVFKMYRKYIAPGVYVGLLGCNA
jgi:hypothetical protein